ncbi:MAG TPA: ABC transporter permease [Kofleriaceae bacterium]|nr:ABC transporter permease [Kofleriaceae bacterium]
MRYLRAAFARLVGVFTWHRTDDDLREELRAHLEMETAEYTRRGLPPDEARRRARLASGGLAQAAEAVRDQRGVPWLEGTVVDLKYAVRALRRTHLFTAVVVITLGLGIGANTAIFSVVRGVLLRPLPHRDGDRLVYLRHSMEAPGGENLTFSVPEVRDLRGGAPSFAGIAEYSSWSSIHETREGAERIAVGLVTGNYFEVMGLGPVLGRVTGPGDDGPGAAPVAVLTHEFWLKRFAGDPRVVGQRVTLSSKPVTVIGVLQPAPFFPDRVDVFLNLVNSAHHLGATMLEGRTHRMTEVVARLAPGATVEKARAEVAAVYARMQVEHREAYDPASHYRVAVIPFKEVMGERARPVLVLLMGAAAFVLIIAAANVANLTLMRSVRREHELVTRAALGAGAARLRRLLLAENLVLALMGTGVGVVIAVGGAGLLESLARRYSTRASEIQLDLPVLGFALALAVAVAVLLSFLTPLPGEGSLGGRMAGAAWRMSSSAGKKRLQRALVVAQIAVSIVLLAGAGLLTRTLVRLSQVETGLITEEVLTMEVPLPTSSDVSRSPAADSWAKQRYAEMRRQVAALPGVIEVGIGSPAPLRRSDVMFDVKAEGMAVAAGEAMPRAELRTVGPEYFRAAGIPLVHGRPFAATDGAGSGKVVIVNQTLADRIFPGRDPVGRRIAWSGEILKFSPLTEEWRTIVGVTRYTQDGGLDAEPRPVVFMPFTQFPAVAGALVIRAAADASALAPAAMSIVRRIVPMAPIENVMTLTQYKDATLSARRLNALLVSLFAVLAVVIAAVGIAGVLAFSVSARTHEIGIRMSLGASPRRVQRMILREGCLLLAIGLVLGLGVASFAVRILRGLLFGIAPDDPSTFIGVAALMAAIGIAACWIPAARAARIDPAVSMRAQ